MNKRVNLFTPIKSIQEIIEEARTLEKLRISVNKELELKFTEHLLVILTEYREKTTKIEIYTKLSTDEVTGDIHIFVNEIWIGKRKMSKTILPMTKMDFLRLLHEAKELWTNPCCGEEIEYLEATDTDKCCGHATWGKRHIILEFINETWYAY